MYDVNTEKKPLKQNKPTHKTPKQTKTKPQNAATITSFLKVALNVHSWIYT